MTAAPLTLDHVLLAAPSEQHARRALDAGQLTPSHGSALPGTGLANLVCPLGDTFLEVLHPSGGEIMASMAAMRDTVLTAAGTTGTTGLAPVGYMLRVPDARLLAAATDRLALPILAARSLTTRRSPTASSASGRPSTGPGCPCSSTGTCPWTATPGERDGTPSTGCPHTWRSPATKPPSTPGVQRTGTTP